MTRITRPSRDDASQSDTRPPRRVFRTLRSRLLISVNLVVGVAIAAFLVVDYRHELDTRIAAHRGALADEARSLLPAIAEFIDHDQVALQRYVDTVCASMQEASSPGHHIVIEFDGAVLQAQSHHRASPDMLARIRTAATARDGRSNHGGSPLLVGTAESDDIRAFVAELIEPIVAETRRQAMMRAAALTTAALLAAGVVNLLLVRLVTRPLERLATVVRQIGGGDLGVTADRLGTEELDLISAEINAMSSELERRSRARTLQIDKARRLQSHLSPRVTSTPSVKVAATCRPADEVAGDYYDVLPREDGTILVCVADVCGHGIPAAMGAAILKTLLLATTALTTEPEEILRLMNEQFLLVSLPEDFASMLVARIAPDGTHFDYVSAGHEPGYVVRTDGTVETLGSSGLLLGVLTGGTWDTRRVELEGGDHLVLLTDGVSEVLDEGSHLLGRKTVAAVLAAHHAAEPVALVKALIDAVDSHGGEGPRSDDQTILVIQSCGARSSVHGARCENLHSEADT